MVMLRFRSIYRVCLPSSTPRQWRATAQCFSSSPPDSHPKGESFLDKLFGEDSNIADKNFTNRWLMAVPAFATHVCIGSPWAWSVMADVVTREIGFVAPVMSDWTLMQTALPLSIVFLLQGLSGGFLGKWQMKAGPRKSLAISSLAFGGGLILGGLSIHFHNLYLLYASYGVLGGTGIGLGYTPPIQTLIQWFPDKKGIASAIAVGGFGSAALVFAPSVQYLMKKFHKLPEYVGPANEFVTKVVDGRLFVELNGSMQEVVNATAGDLAKLPYQLNEGLYLVGTGNTGAAEALMVMGSIYFTLIFSSALTLKKPHPSFVPSGMATPATTTSTTSAITPNINVDQAMSTPQFYLLGTTFFCLATGGMGLFSVAKPLMSEVFSGVLPAIVTSAFASKFVLMLSAGNLGGRLGWAALSDTIGPRKTFIMFTTLSAPLYFALPTIVDSVITTQSALPLYMFCGSTALAVSFMGGVYSVLPAYEANIFGINNVGPIHGRMLVYSSAAAMVGPYMLLKLRAISEKAAIQDLAKLVDPVVFAESFGKAVDNLDVLLATKSINISKILVLCPPGTIDPTPHLYDTTMYALGTLMVAAVVSHGLVKQPQIITVKPVDKKE